MLANHTSLLATKTTLQYIVVDSRLDIMYRHSLLYFVDHATGIQKDVAVTTYVSVA